MTCHHCTPFPDPGAGLVSHGSPYWRKATDNINSVSVSTTLLEVGKIAQVLRNLFYKHEDPSSMSRTHVKSLSMVVCFYNPRAGELGHLGPWGSLAIGELQASERLFRNVLRVIFRLSFGFHMHACTCMYIHV